MNWSKVKQNVENCFAPSIKGRVELRATAYRSTDKRAGRGYIAVDGKIVWDACTMKFWEVEGAQIRLLKQEAGKSSFAVQGAANRQLALDGIMRKSGFIRTLERYGSVSVERALESGNVLAQSIAMLDARLGKRRLKSLDVSGLDPLVQYFHHLRCEAEGIRIDEKTVRIAPNVHKYQCSNPGSYFCFTSCMLLECPKALPEYEPTNTPEIG